MSSDRIPLIQARALTKRFDKFTAVDGIDFDVRSGETFGFLGPNGAGKTSTMRMIGCTSPPTEGKLRIMNMDPAANASQIKARLGVVPQQDNLDIELTVRENLLMYARYFDIPRATAVSRANELLQFVQLTEKADAQVEALSGGLKRRLTIARALVNEPDIVLLDEPTTGLDPQARHVIWERLYQLKRRGATLLLTTHYMDEAEQLCDRLVVMDKAKIVAEGSPRELIDRYSTREVLEVRLRDDVRASIGVGGPEGSKEVAARRGTEAIPRVGPTLTDGALDGLASRTETLPDRILLYTEDGEQALEHVHARGIPLESALVRRSTLEDVFLRLTGRSLNE